MSVASYSQVACAVVRCFRELRGLEQQDLAQSLGVPKSTWSKVERGGSPLTLDMLATIAKLWCVPPASVMSYIDFVVGRLEGAGWEVVAGLEAGSLAPNETVYKAAQSHAAEALRIVINRLA